MRKLLCLLLLLVLGLSCCAFAAEDTLTGVPQDEITAQWGSPEKLLNYTVGIWKRDGQTLVATFAADMETQQLLVQDYVILDSERQLLAGTIPAWWMSAATRKSMRKSRRTVTSSAGRGTARTSSPTCI